MSSTSARSSAAGPLSSSGVSASAGAGGARASVGSAFAEGVLRCVVLRDDRAALFLVAVPVDTEPVEGTAARSAVTSALPLVPPRPDGFLMAVSGLEAECRDADSAATTDGLSRRSVFDWVWYAGRR